MIIGLTYDLRSEYKAAGYKDHEVAEFDSDETISSLQETIESLGYKTDRIGHFRNLCSRLASGQSWDLVFNLAEGLSGRFRESEVPCLLEAYNIGYTFSDPLVCAITLDKSLAKRIACLGEIPTPPFAVIEKLSQLEGINLVYPLFAKPVAEGTSKGIDQNCRVDNSRQLEKICEDLLARFKQPVIVEEFLPGREFTVALLGTGDDAYVLGIMEITMADGRKEAIYSYTVKELCETLVKYLPFNGPMYEQIAQLALKAYRLFQCRDAGRVDVRCDRQGNPAFIEINPLPGLHPTHSDLPMIASQQKVSYTDLVGRIINSSFARLKGSIGSPNSCLRNKVLGNPLKRQGE
jgi:D-alanine-D-alanine ligase